MKQHEKKKIKIMIIIQSLSHIGSYLSQIKWSALQFPNIPSREHPFQA